MDKIDFLIGSEKRFSEFISKLNDKDKIALVSHVDTDGIVSAKVVNKVLNADMLKFVDYAELNDSLVEGLKKSGVKKVVMTDLCVKNREFILKIEKFAEILLIDHHPPLEDFNSERTVFIDAQGYCAAYMCYYLFSKVQNLEKMDWLVACASVADWMYFKNASWMKEIYEKYGDEFVGTPEMVRESRKFWPLIVVISNAIIYFTEDLKRVYDSIGDEFGKVGDLGKYSDEVEAEIENCLRRFEKEKILIKDGYFWEFSSKLPVRSSVITIASCRNPGKTIIMAQEKGAYYKFSARRQDGKVNVNELLVNLTRGMEGSNAGGHAMASGGFILIKDKEEFKKRLLGL